tara:strand:- start:2993 stop:3694 length:702 start_codon:yes stop_codon:yes gene_type:complete
MVAASMAHAEVKLIGGEVPYFCYMEGSTIKGVACDILSEMARRTGHSGKIQLKPFARAILESKNGPEVVMVPLAKTPVRQNDFLWPIKILEEEFLIVASKENKVDISNFNSAQKLKIGYLRGGAADQLIIDYKLEDTEATSIEMQNAMKLSLGRIDAWMGSWNTIKKAQVEAGLSVDNLRRGSVGFKSEIYFATSKDMTSKDIQKWQEAFDNMKADGSYSTILDSYSYELPRE